MRRPGVPSQTSNGTWTQRLHFTRLWRRRSRQSDTARVLRDTTSELLADIHADIWSQFGRRIDRLLDDQEQGD